MGASRRVGIGLLASALFVFGIAFAPNAGAVADVDVIRYAGTDRYGTAQDIATDPAFDGATTAIVARGDKFPDALAASSIAGTEAPAPIILTEQNVYRAEAKAALADLGVDDVIIVGGTAAVSQSVEDAIEADGYTVSRLAGTDRYGTAADIAGDTAGGDVGGLNTAVIAAADLVNGVDNNFVDALAGGPVAYSETLPLLLVTKDNVPAVTKSTLESLDIEQVIILGGTVRVPASVETELETITGNPALRLAGNDRFLTAIEIADFEIETLGWNVDEIIDATAFNFPDALAAGPLGGEHEAPIVLTNVEGCNADTVAWVEDHSDTIATIFIVGGTLAVSQAAEDCIEAAAEGAGGAGSATALPELQSASILSTTTAAQATPSQPQGTVVKFTFDEPVGTPTPGSFFVTDSGTATPTPGSSIATNPANTDTRSVNVLFSTINTTAQAGGLAVATVAEIAVTDTQGNGNPFGDAAIGTSGTQQAQAGVTTAPDLVSVGNLRQTGNADASGGSGFTTVDFTFDQAATAVDANVAGYHLVLTSPSAGDPTAPPPAGEVDCTGPTTAQNPGVAGNTSPNRGGSGTTVIAVVCPDLASAPTTPITAAQVAYGYIDAGTVTSSASSSPPSQPNVAQAANVSGNSPYPELTAVAFQAGTATNDVAVFTFDEPVGPQGSLNPADFHAYNANAATTPGTAIQSVSADGKSVAVSIANGFADNAVGGYVDEGGAPATTGTLPRVNRFTEASGPPLASTTLTPGKTAAPDLVSVALSPITDAFGTTTGWSGIYTFDQAFTAGPTTNSNYRLYIADGTEFSCNGAGSTFTADPSQLAGQQTRVICSSWTVSATQPRSGGATTATPPTAAQVGSSVAGAVAQGDVSNGSGGNPIGFEFTTGGTGTRTS